MKHQGQYETQVSVGLDVDVLDTLSILIQFENDSGAQVDAILEF